MGRFLQAVGDEIDDLLDLVASDATMPLDDVVDACSPGEAPSPKEKRRRSAWVSRKLRLLRAPGLLQKVPPTHRYLVTAPGRKILTAALTLTQATIAQLTSLAA